MSGPMKSTLGYVSKMIIKYMFMHLIMIYKSYEFRHAGVILRIPRECFKLIEWTKYLCSGSCWEAKITATPKRNYVSL